MYQVIARKYRPQSFSELIGQEHVKTTLENAIAQQRIAHGYIFSGQRGTGKTTVARILARCLNCEFGPTATPCGKCASCVEIAEGHGVDVIEIDAASNRGINEMRELRENVRYRPARDRYKIFIVDEAHQITSEAFNALLKTLEEPPEWVVFLLCTTEAHKIPSTIASRCQQFSFRSVDFAEVVARLDWIAKQEGIEADTEALSVLARAGEGSVRDSLSALDQAIACCGQKLNAAEVRGLLGMFSIDSLDQVTQALAAVDSKRMLDIVAELESNGRSLQHFARELARYFRNLLVMKITGSGDTQRLVPASPNEQVKLSETAAQFSEEDLTRYLQLSLDVFSDLQTSLQPRLHLEIGLLRMVHAGRLQSIEDALAGLGPAGLTGTGASGAGLSGAGSSSSGSSAPSRTTPPSKAVTRPAPVSAAPQPSAKPQASPSPEVLSSPRVAPNPSAPPNPGASPIATSPTSLSPAGDLRSRLHAALIESKQMHIADAVEHSDLVESANDLVITTPKMYAMYLKQPGFEVAVTRLLERSVRITIKVGEPAATEVSGDSGSVGTPVGARPGTRAGDTRTDETSARALENPEVQRFQEMFPDSQVRTVRNLRDN
jgi:DNA polymerase III subunit gamma/tau